MRGVDHEASRVEGVGEYLVELEVPGAGLRLVGGEHENGLAPPLLELHLGDAGA